MSLYTCVGTYLDVMLKDVRGAPDGRHVVYDELAVRREEVSPLVQFLNTSLILTVCKASHTLSTVTLAYFIVLNET